MDFPSRPAVSCEIPTGLLAALGLEMAEVMREPRDFLIVANHAAIVENVKPDIAALAKIDMGIGGAIITAAGENDVDYVCRFFAPSEGIDEDPPPDQSSAHSSHTGPDALASKHFECSNSLLVAPGCRARWLATA